MSEVVSSHQKYLTEMKKGSFYPGIEKDPRKSKEADEKVTLANTANYGLSSQKTMLADKNVHVT